MPSKNVSQTRGDAGSQEAEWPDGPGTPQLREGPHASFLQSPATGEDFLQSPAPYHTHIDRGRIYMPTAGRTLHLVPAWSGNRATPVRRRQQGKGALPRQRRSPRASHLPSGTQEVTKAALSTAGGGRPHCSPRCRSVLAPASPGDCPISHPWREWGRAPAPCSHLHTDAATDKRPRPHIAVSEDVSGARRAGSPAPCQPAIHGGPCLPGAATKPPATQGLYFK